VRVEECADSRDGVCRRQLVGPRVGCIFVGHRVEFLADRCHHCSLRPRTGAGRLGVHGMVSEPVGHSVAGP
jgi:hypothetical protein